MDTISYLYSIKENVNVYTICEMACACGVAVGPRPSRAVPVVCNLYGISRTGKEPLVNA